MIFLNQKGLFSIITSKNFSFDCTFLISVIVCEWSQSPEENYLIFTDPAIGTVVPVDCGPSRPETSIIKAAPGARALLPIFFSHSPGERARIVN
jgi:hypothetical protein